MSLSRTAIYRLLAVSAALLPVLAGCGGAGTPGTTTGGTTGTTRASDGMPDGNRKAEGQVGRVGVFVTASGLSNYDHLWVTVRKVTLIDVTETAQTVYDDPDGFTVDLKDLAQAKKLALLTCAAAPSGKSYLRVRLTFDKSINAFETGAQVAKILPLADSIARDEQDNPMLTMTLNHPRDLGNGKESLVADFDLTKFTVNEGRALLAVKEGSGDWANDLGRQEAGAFAGAVSDVASTDQGMTFTLTVAPNRTLTVQTSPGTIYYNDNGAPSPSVVTGKQVTVRGMLAGDTKRVLATEVVVGSEAKDAKPDTTRAMAVGRVLSVDANSGTVALAPVSVSRLSPTVGAITVLVAPDALLRSSGGVKIESTDFYAAAGKSGALVRFEGAFEPVTGTLKANRAKLEDAKFNPSHEAVVHGNPVAVNEKSKALSIEGAAEWQGIALKDGAKPLPITTTGATTYQDGKGGAVDPATFYTAANKGENSVRVTGIFSDGKITATRLELLPALPKPVAKTEGKEKEGEKSKEEKPAEGSKTEATTPPASGDEKKAEPATPPADKPAEKPTEPATPPTDKPIEPATPPADKPAVPPTEKPATPPIEKPTEPAKP